jgi:hypothetical protein
MASWTNWKLLAKEGEWFDDDFDNYNGPACYELAVAGPRGGDLEIMYVGETAHEKDRIRQYAQNGSHLSTEIARELRKGWALFYRAQAKTSKQAAKSMQDRLLVDFEYPWNVLNNPKD